MAAESISTEERANARAMSAELEDIKQQINDLTPRSRAREIAKQSKIAMGYRGEDDYGMEDEVRAASRAQLARGPSSTSPGAASTLAACCAVARARSSDAALSARWASA